MNVHEVFTPGNYPDHTYVERGQGEHERNLKFHLQESPTIVSLSGPSKSGKTILLNNVIDQLDFHLLRVYGSNISSIEDLWNEALDELNAPSNREVVEGSQKETVKEGQAGVNVPGVQANAGGTKRTQDSTRETIKRGRRGLREIVDIVDLDELVLYIDDAHYIDEGCHDQVAEGIKEAYERGMSICVAFIPYRSDDLTRANPDLSGRIESISLDYWDSSELEKIGELGYNHLKRSPSDLLLRTLARESVGSPHLMQRLCLEMCNEMEIHESIDEMTPMDSSSEDIENVLRRTAENMDYSTVYEILCGDTSQGGNDRNKFDFKFKGEGDVYDVILRAIISNPPKLTLKRGELIERVDEVCRKDPPRSGYITETIRRMDKWISDKNPNNDFIFDWVEDRKCLETPDPDLIFHLRWSNRMEFEPKLP